MPSSASNEKLGWESSFWCEYGWQIGFGLQIETDFGLMSLKELAKVICEENPDLERKRLKIYLNSNYNTNFTMHSRTPNVFPSPPPQNPTLPLLLNERFKFCSDP